MRPRGFGPAIAGGWIWVLAIALAAAKSPTSAYAQIPTNCSEVCGTSCVRPIALPDRWDDVTAIPGFDGTDPHVPNWRNNGKYDQEPFNDVNGNGLWDPGEPFIDYNGNGRHDAEAYDPLTTGYIADPVAANVLAPSGDFGSLLTLEYDNSSAPVPGNYMPIDLPPLNKGTPITGSEAFSANFTGCNAAVVEPGDALQTEPGGVVGPTGSAFASLVAQDPNAYWDPISQSVQGSAFALSPRVMLLAAWDPRTYPTSGRIWVEARKIVPVFIEQVVGTAAASVRLLRVETRGAACASGSTGGWLYSCGTPATRATWGQVKASYR